MSSYKIVLRLLSILCVNGQKNDIFGKPTVLLAAVCHAITKSA